MRSVPGNKGSQKRICSEFPPYPHVSVLFLTKRRIHLLIASEQKANARRDTAGVCFCRRAVSYTHLDVYKRQVENSDVMYIHVLPQSKKLVFTTQNKGDCSCNFDGSDFQGLSLPEEKQ